MASLGKFSNKCHYALQAALELGKQQGNGILTISQIAKRQGIPNRFLEAILNELKKGGIADSIRGNTGGYFLSRPAAEITVGEVVRLFEGRRRSTKARQAPHRPPPRSVSMASVIINELYDEAQQAFMNTLDTITLQELLSRSDYLEAVPNYCI